MHIKLKKADLKEGLITLEKFVDISSGEVYSNKILIKAIKGFVFMYATKGENSVVYKIDSEKCEVLEDGLEVTEFHSLKSIVDTLSDTIDIMHTPDSFIIKSGLSVITRPTWAIDTSIWEDTSYQKGQGYDISYLKQIIPWIKIGIPKLTDKIISTTEGNIMGVNVTRCEDIVSVESTDTKNYIKVSCKNPGEDFSMYIERPVVTVFTKVSLTDAKAYVDDGVFKALTPSYMFNIHTSDYKFPDTTKLGKIIPDTCCVTFNSAEMVNSITRAIKLSKSKDIKLKLTTDVSEGLLKLEGFDSDSTLNEVIAVSSISGSNISVGLDASDILPFLRKVKSEITINFSEQYGVILLKNSKYEIFYCIGFYKT